MNLRNPLAAVSCVVSLLCAPAAHAQSADAYPAKPVTLVVPTAAAGGTDVMARLFAERLAKGLGQTFVIDNKPGANGMLGTSLVARAAPDGYTLLFSYAAAHAANPSLYRNVPYDAAKDFVPIVQIGRVGNLILVRADSPVKTLKEFIDLVKSKPDQFSYCSWGIGSGGHIAMESLKKQTGMKMTHIPYKGNAPCIQDLLGGQVPFAFGDVSSNAAQVKAGKLRALAYSGPSRLPSLPDVPTMTEAGYPFTLYAWYGIFAPAGTPPVIVAKVNVEVNKALADPAIKERLAQLNIHDAPPNTPEQFAKNVRADLAGWGAVIRELDIKLD
jgi:tripartite-type tricarboxylate transporter receptor subunit TctC